MQRLRMKAYLLLTLILGVFILPGCGGDAGNGVWDKPGAAAKAITAYSLNGTSGIISEETTPKTIEVIMPYGTDLSLPLTATWLTTGESVFIGATEQFTALPPTNVFTQGTPKVYTVNPADDSAAASYNVNVSVALASDKKITSYSLNGTAGIISEETIPKTITVLMPFGTDLSLPLTATYTTTGASVMVGATLQASGITTNVFPLSPPASAIYTVTAADGVTTATYNVNVTVAAGNAATITAFSLDGTVGIISEGTTPKTIDVVMPVGTDLTLPLTATYVTTGASVMVGATSQTSGFTTNVFPLSPPASAIYTVTAADGVTTATYNVNVTVALEANPDAPALGETERFVILASQAITTTTGSAIADGDLGLLDQARSFYAGFTAGIVAGEFDELVNGVSFAPDDSTPPYVVPVPYASTVAFINQVRTDLGNAAIFLEADPNTNVLVQTKVCPSELGDLTLTRGVYRTTSNVTIQTGNLTLDAQGDPDSVWIFQMVGTGTLATGAPGGSIILTGGAQAKNVYWRTAGTTIIGTNTIFQGNVFAWPQINVNTGADVIGRLFSVTEQVTLDANAVTKAP